MTVSATDPLAQYYTNSSTQASGKSELGQDDFLSLMLAQMRNQDPIHPLEGKDFLAQLAQFTSVSGIQNLNTSMQTMIDSLHNDQALTAANFVGKTVLVEGDQATLAEGHDLVGAVSVQSSGNVEVDIMDAAGNVVRHISLGQQSSGVSNFSWDGLNVSGEPCVAGVYSISATVNGKEAVTLGGAPVDSVSFTSQGSILGLSGLGPYSLDSIYQIQQ